MDIEELISSFEDYYNIEITNNGIKVLENLYEQFDEEVTEDALIIAFEQYDNPQEAFDKLGGICYNITQPTIRYNK